MGTGVACASWRRGGRGKKHFFRGADVTVGREKKGRTGVEGKGRVNFLWAGQPLLPSQLSSGGRREKKFRNNAIFDNDSKKNTILGKKKKKGGAHLVVCQAGK